jgi:excisionase family DNA binding protein
MNQTLDILLAKYGPTMIIDEVAEVLRVSTKTIQRRMVTEGVIPSFKDTGRRLFQTTDVAEYIQNNTSGANQ